MTTKEFSTEFDILCNSSSLYENDIRFDEYQKSVFLTKAQEDIVLSFYNGKNTYGESFEKNEEMRRYLNELVKTYTTTTKKTGVKGLNSKSIFFTLPTDLWFITYEEVILSDNNLGCMNNITIPVIPITQNDYYNTINNPFRGPNNRRAIRLDIHNNTVEIISKYNIKEYLVRYLSKPEPIITTSLVADGLSINGFNTINECKLNPVLHKAILEQAVIAALNSKVKRNNDKEV